MDVSFAPMLLRDGSWGIGTVAEASRDSETAREREIPQGAFPVSSGVGKALAGVASPAVGFPASSPSGLLREQEAAEQLERAEAEVLAAEQALRSAGGAFVRSIRYGYETGPDGRRYVTSASVEVSAPEEEQDRLAALAGVSEGVSLETLPAEEGASTEETEDEGSVGASDARLPGAEEEGAGPDEGAATAETAPKTSGKADSSSDPDTRRVLAELAATDREVRAHEAAHQAAGGGFTGAATFTYVTGPDGKRYAAGGEVPIQIPAADTPEEDIANLERVRAAALAPANPSGQDLSVAASASSGIAQATAELIRKRAESSYGDQMRFSDRRSSGGEIESPEGGASVLPLPGGEETYPSARGAGEAAWGGEDFFPPSLVSPTDSWGISEEAGGLGPFPRRPLDGGLSGGLGAARLSRFEIAA
jgi:hypothetical protein